MTDFKEIICRFSQDVCKKGHLSIAWETDDYILLELNIENHLYKQSSQSVFEALRQLNHTLQKEHIQIICNGCAENVYPSPMMLNMGNGMLAYKLKLGQPAKKEDVVNIFDVDESLNFVDATKQKDFYQEWLCSL